MNNDNFISTIETCDEFFFALFTRGNYNSANVTLKVSHSWSTVGKALAARAAESRISARKAFMAELELHLLLLSSFFTPFIRVVER